MSSLSESLVLLLANRVSFAIILIEKTIYDRLIKLNSIDIIFEANSIDT